MPLSETPAEELERLAGALVRDTLTVAGPQPRRWSRESDLDAYVRLRGSGVVAPNEREWLGRMIELLDTRQTAGGRPPQSTPASLDLGDDARRVVTGVLWPVAFTPGAQQEAARTALDSLTNGLARDLWLGAGTRKGPFATRADMPEATRQSWRVYQQLLGEHPGTGPYEVPIDRIVTGGIVPGPGALRARLWDRAAKAGNSASTR